MFILGFKLLLFSNVLRDHLFMNLYLVGFGHPKFQWLLGRWWHLLALLLEPTKPVRLRWQILFLGKAQLFHPFFDVEWWLIILHH